MKKILSVLLIVLLIFAQLPTAIVEANTYNSTTGIVIIDTPWLGTLQDEVEALGITATDVRELHITATDTMDSTDIAYINSMSNLKIIEVADTVIIENVGDSFMSGLKYLTDITFPASTFGNSSFEYCYQLKNVSLPKATSFGDGSFSSCYQLENISLPKATTFGDYVLSSCRNLSSINLPEAMTFGESAFMDCSNLENVSLPKATTFGNYTFSSCYQLENISLPKATTFGNYTFSSCRNLASINLPEAMTFGESAFLNCSNLEDVNLPKATTFGDSAFGYCRILDSINLPEAMTFGRYAFEGCSVLDSVNLPNVTSFGDYAFSYCYKLNDVNLPKVTAFGDSAFYECYQPIVLTLGPTVPTATNDTFAQNTGTVIVPLDKYEDYDSDNDGTWFGWRIKSPGTVEIDSAWSGTLKDAIEALDGITDATDVIELFISATDTLDNDDIDYIQTMTNLRVLDIADTVTLGDVGDNFFSGHGLLREVTLPSTTLGASVFNNCDALLKVVLPNVTSIGDNLFEGCNKDIQLTLGGTIPSVNEDVFTGYEKSLSIIVPDSAYQNYDNDTTQSTTGSAIDGKWFDWNLVTDGIITIDTPWSESGTLEDAITTSGGITVATDIRQLYITATDTMDSTDIAYIKNMTNLEILEVSDTVTVGDVGDDFLYDLEHLAKVTFPATTFGNNAFNACHQLKEISLLKATTFGDYAFGSNHQLKEITLPEATTFGGYAFYGCKKLENVSLPIVTDFGEEAFTNCSYLETISLPEVITFGVDAFDNCYYLKNLNLPKVTIFGNDAFEDCYRLKNVNLPNVVEFDNDAFQDCYSLESISLPEVTTFGNDAFEDCYQLKNVNLPNVVEFGEDAFEDCYSLESISLPKATTFGNDAFGDCYQLKSVDLPKATAFEGKMFHGCLNKITMTLGTNIPTMTASSPFSAYDPINRQAVVQVPKSMISAYDGDPQDTSGSADDGLWFGWKIEGAPSSSGSSSTTKYYTIKTSTGEGGSIDGYKIVRVKSGRNIEFNITPDEGYEIEDVKVDDKSVGAVSSYEFTKVRANHTISATFKKIEVIEPDIEEKYDFTDVSEDEWYYEPIMKACNNGWFLGTSDTTFSPNIAMSRGMVVTVLWRIEGEPASEANNFTDVMADKYYTKAVNWAADQGIVNGYGNNLFGPEDSISREQIASILYRYAQHKDYDTTQGGMAIREFSDYENISEYALPTLAWGVNTGLMQGANNMIMPKDDATRAQVATILVRFSETIVK